MSSDLEASSVVVTNGGEVRPSRSFWIASLKYLLLIVAVVSPYAAAFLVYPLPAVSDSLYDLSYICWFFIAFVSLGVLLLRRWIAVAIFAAAWIWLFYGPSYGPGDSFYWLVQQGFRLHASPVKDYLSRCELVDFVENGLKQTIGRCEAADEGTVISGVFYDTSGEFALPLSKRTPEWKQAMATLVPDEVLEWRASPLSGDFYRTMIPLEKYRG